jgi:uncharacterized repeat protein (TIGR03943 family)
VIAVRALRGGLLLGLAAAIGKLLATGQMAKYMTPALDLLSLSAALVLALMGLSELAAHRRASGSPPPAAGDTGRLEETLTALLVGLVLALTLVVSPRALGTSGLGGERLTSLLLAFAPGPAAAPATAGAPAPPLDDLPAVLAALRTLGPATVGRSVRLIGTAALSEDLPAGELALLRYAIVHCVADARPIALLVTVPPGVALAPDDWVEVEGTLSVRERGGDRLVTIEAQRITRIAEPPMPYLSAL